MAIDYLQLHKDKKKELQELNDRRKSDNELVTSRNYILRDVNDKRIDDVLMVTMNRLKVFKAYVLASLGRADEKVEVTSSDLNMDTAIKEEFIRAAFRSGNDRLQKRGEFLLEPFIDQQSCMNGQAALEILWQQMPAKDGKEAYLDTAINAWDTEFMTYEQDVENLAWAGYEIPMTKGAIEGQAWAVQKGFVADAKEKQVVTLWTPTDYLIYIGDTEVYKMPHDYKSPQVVLQGVPLGSMKEGKDNLKYKWESIFFLVREMIEEYNMCISVLQTLNIKEIKQALQMELKPGQEPPDYIDVAGTGSITGTTSGKIDLVPYGDARQSMLLALQEINKALSDGTLSRITLGDLPGELSAVALLQIEQGQGQVFMPRLGNRGLLKAQAARKIIQQVIDIGGKIEIGADGHKRTFNAKDLEGQYDINYIYANKNPETEFARVRIAKEYEGVFDELTILTDVLKRDDPENDLMNINIQRATRGSRSLTMYDQLLSLRKKEEQGDEEAADKANLLEMELNITIEQLQQGILPTEEGAPLPNGAAPSLPAMNTNTQAMDLTRSVQGEPAGGTINAS